MKLLLAYLTVLGSVPQDPRSLKSVTESYLRHADHVLIMSNQPGLWTDVLIGTPVTIQRWPSDPLRALAMIVDLRGANLTESNIEPTKNNAKLLIVVEENQENEIMEAVTEMGLCQAVVVTIKESDFRIRSFVDVCKGIGTQQLPGEEDTCRGNVSFMDLPPNNLFEGEKLSGFEGKMIQTAAAHMRIELDLINSHETGYGQFSPPSGLQGDLSTGRCIAALGALYPFRTRWLNSEMIFGCQTTSIAWSTPIGAGPTSPTWFIILVSELSPTVWVLTLTVFIGLIPMSFIFDTPIRHNLLRPFHILALFLGISQRRIFHKRFTILVMFFGFTVSAYYQAMMSSKLTVPMKIPEITSLLELAESGLKLTGPPTHGKVMADVAAAAPSDAAKQKILQNFVVTEATADETLPEMANLRDRAYLRHAFNLNYLSEKNSLTAGKIHIVEEAIATFIPVTLTPKNSCLAPRIQDIYLRLCGSGLASKWLADFTAKKKSATAQGPTKLSIDHIRGFLYLLILGWIISTVAFVCEKAMHAGKKAAIATYLCGGGDGNYWYGGKVPEKGNRIVTTKAWA